MGAGLFIAGMLLNAGSSILQGRAREMNARFRAQQAERNALILEQEATARERKARFDQVRAAEAGARDYGRLLSKLGWSGARLDVGAPIRALSEQAAETELDIELIGHEGAVDAWRLRSQAGIERAKRSIFKQKARYARISAVTGGATSLLEDFATGKEKDLF